MWSPARTVVRSISGTHVARRSVATAPKPAVRKYPAPTYTKGASATAYSKSKPVVASTSSATKTAAPVAAATPSKNAEFDMAEMRSMMDDHLPEVATTSAASPSTPAPAKAAPPSPSTVSTSYSSSPAEMPFPASSSLPQSSFPSNAEYPPSTAHHHPAASPVSHQAPIELPAEQLGIDWTTSFHGVSSMPFSQRQADILMRPLEPPEIEIKPDGLLYLPEILYRRILNRAFGPGGWGMVPRGEMTIIKMTVTREWGLVAGGRLISVARGEQQFFDQTGLPTATEGCKSNALMRCCKDLGIASELWDPSFIRTFKAAHCVEAWTEHGSTKKKQKRWRKKGNKFEYPLVEVKFA